MSKEIETAQKALEKLLKDKTVVNMKKDPVITHLVPSRFPSVNYLIDGGYPVGKLMLFAGEKSAGKTTFAIQEAPGIAWATAKLKGREDKGKILFLDNERTTTTEFIEMLGQESDIFFLNKVDTTETMLDMARELAPAFDVVIIDSLSNSASNEQMQKTASERSMANRARVMSEQLPILIGVCDRNMSSLIILGQIRENMDKKHKFDDDYVVPGGQSVHHNSSLTLQMFPSSKIQQKDPNSLEFSRSTAGRKTRIICAKNKNGVAHRQIMLEIDYGKGFDLISDVVEAGKSLGVVDQSGSWYSYKGTKIGQGLDKVKATLEENPDMLDDVIKEINKKDLNK